MYDAFFSGLDIMTFQKIQALGIEICLSQAKMPHVFQLANLEHRMDHFNQDSTPLLENAHHELHDKVLKQENGFLSVS